MTRTSAGIATPAPEPVAAYSEQMVPTALETAPGHAVFTSAHQDVHAAEERTTEGVFNVPAQSARDDVRCSGGAATMSPPAMTETASVPTAVPEQQSSDGDGRSQACEAALACDPHAMYGRYGHALFAGSPGFKCRGVSPVTPLPLPPPSPILPLPYSAWRCCRHRFIARHVARLCVAAPTLAESTAKTKQVALTSALHHVHPHWRQSTCTPSLIVPRKLRAYPSPCPPMLLLRSPMAVSSTHTPPTNVPPPPCRPMRSFSRRSTSASRPRHRRSPQPGAASSPKPSRHLPHSVRLPPPSTAPHAHSLD